MVRAPVLHTGGQRFESSIPHFLRTSDTIFIAASRKRRLLRLLVSESFRGRV